MFAESIFRVSGTTQYFDCLIFLAFRVIHPGRRSFYLQLEVLLEVIELRVFRLLAELLHPRDRFPRAIQIAGVCSTESVSVLDQRLHEWKNGPMWYVWN